MKIGFLITARLKSTRLKQKILLDLNGKSVLDRVIERCKAVKGIDGVVLCTSTNPQDSILYENALNNQIQFYAGSEDDVLARLLEAAKYYGYDGFISITADNPLHSIYIAQLVVDFCKKGQHDFIFTSGLPLGIAPYFLNTKALEVACYMKREANTEIWGPFVNQPDFFNIGKIKITNSPYKDNYRLTCDYPKDYSLFLNIYREFSPAHNPTIFEVFNLMKRKPELWRLNETIKQASVEDLVLQKIKKQFCDMKSKGIKYAKSIQKSLNPAEDFLKIEI